VKHQQQLPTTQELAHKVSKSHGVGKSHHAYGG